MVDAAKQAVMRPGLYYFLILIFIYLFIWLCQVLVAALGIFSCGM